jgi:hypothetical protein
MQITQPKNALVLAALSRSGAGKAEVERQIPKSGQA